MNKVIMTMICIIVVLGAMFIGIAVYQNQKENNSESEIKNESTEIAEEILDDCTDEYEALENEKIIQANSEQEKISPTSSFIVKTYYKDCGHIKTEQLELPEDLVNCTKEQLQSKYSEYTIEKFSSDEIILFQEKEGECNEHYIVKEKGGKIVVYQKQKNGEEVLIKNTDISTDYLPETDKINIKNGIEINGKQELNQLIEDFE